MSETPTTSPATGGTPTPAGARGKRRGLALPPRGQALTRLQDLEADGAPPVPDANTAVAGPEMAPSPEVTASSNAVKDAVNTASSNAVIPQVITAGGGASRSPARPEAPALPEPAAGRAAREPTTRITVDMPDSLHRRISLLSVEERRSIKDLVIEALHRTYFQPGVAPEPGTAPEEGGR